MTDAVLYKTVSREQWSTTEAEGVFRGSPADLRDGFIHLSSAAQVAETAARHFAGLADLLLVAVDAAVVPVTWERSRGGDVFPHLYAPLPLSAVQWVMPLPLGPHGRHVFPPL